MNGNHWWYLHSPSKFFPSALSNAFGTRNKSHGFYSLYGVTKETKEAIVAAGTTEGYKGPVWDPALWIDIDDNEKAKLVEERLLHAGLKLSVFVTGNRGLHFRIEREAPPSHLLPAWDKSWVSSTVPEADKTIYTHLHLFRAIGARHEKTGRPKELVREHPGRSLTFKEIQKASQGRLLNSPGPGAARGSSMSIFDDAQVKLLLVPPPQGERHKRLYGLAAKLQEMGRGQEFARELLEELNLMCFEPKPQEELDDIVQSVFG